MLKKHKNDNLASEWIGLIGKIIGTGSNDPSLQWTDTAPATVLSSPSVPRVVFSGWQRGTVLGLAGTQAPPATPCLG